MNYNNIYDRIANKNEFKNISVGQFTRQQEFKCRKHKKYCCMECINMDNCIGNLKKHEKKLLTKHNNCYYNLKNIFFMTMSIIVLFNVKNYYNLLKYITVYYFGYKIFASSKLFLNFITNKKIKDIKENIDYVIDPDKFNYDLELIKNDLSYIKSLNKKEKKELKNLTVDKIEKYLQDNKNIELITKRKKVNTDDIRLLTKPSFLLKIYNNCLLMQLYRDYPPNNCYQKMLDNHKKLTKFRINNVQNPASIIQTDFEKAFDSVDRTKIIKILTEKKFNYLIPCIQYLNTCSYKYKGNIVLENRIFGIPQGLPLSTAIFNICIEYILSKNYNKNEIDLTILTYVDDIILLLKNPNNEHYDTIRKIFKDMEDFGLYINYNKSSIINNFTNLNPLNLNSPSKNNTYLGKFLVSFDLDVNFEKIKGSLEEKFQEKKDYYAEYIKFAKKNKIENYEYKISQSVNGYFNWLMSIYNCEINSHKYFYDKITNLITELKRKHNININLNNNNNLNDDFVCNMEYNFI